MQGAAKNSLFCGRTDPSLCGSLLDIGQKIRLRQGLGKITAFPDPDIREPLLRYCAAVSEEGKIDICRNQMF